MFSVCKKKKKKKKKKKIANLLEGLAILNMK